MLTATRPNTEGLSAYLASYVSHARGEDLFSALANASAHAERLAELIPADKHEHRYAPGKWSIKEVVQHVNDAERIFAYRALRFARKDITPLPGFEENDYAPASKADRRTLQDLWEEHMTIRRSTVLLFSSFTPDMLEHQGTAGGNVISVRALGWVIAGHAEHHWNIITERYL
ncbi:MAG: DinB family protein [Flavobacteriales bacterium]|nr:DinB family protein [Flavobacteriales bacterium]